MHPHHCPAPRFSWPSLWILCALATLLPCLQAAEASRRSFDIPADAAERALKTFSAQAGQQVLYTTETASGVRTQAVRGSLTPREAIGRLLQGTVLTATQEEGSGVWRIRRKGDAPAAPSASSSSSPTQTASDPAPLSSADRPRRGAGTLGGRVSNAATGAFLHGAVVEIAALGRRVETDVAGEYVFIDLPAGEHSVSVFYTGLDTAQRLVTLQADTATRVNFDLSSGVYHLEKFIVTGEREGNAAALTRQRNAPNVRNVVAPDAFGNLPNEAVGELLMRLPGVNGEIDTQENVLGIGIRGTPSGLNSVAVDGNEQATSAGFARDFRINQLSSALFEEIEVNKTPTPDMPADGLGGAVNMRTRSPLTMKEKRRFSYRVATRWAPPFFDHIPMRRDHPAHPLVSVGYQEVFDAFGGDRNLGVSLSVFYSENVAGYFHAIRDYEYTTSPVAYVWDYRTNDVLINRKQKAGINLKFDYRLSKHTQIYVSTIYNDAPTPFNQQNTFRAYTGRTIATIGANGLPTGTGAILPGYTDVLTQVRGVAASTVQLNSTNYTFNTRERQVNAGAKHDFGRLRLDYDGGLSLSHTNLGNTRGGPNAGGIFTMDVTGVGWILDQSQSSVRPSFRQTEGRDIYDAASYRNGLLTSRDNKRNQDIVSASANARYLLPTSFDATLKTGLRFRSRKAEEQVIADRRWNYVGTESLSALADTKLVTSSGRLAGRELPFVASTLASVDIAENPSRWNEDRYYAEQRRFVGTRDVTEDVTASYLQGETRLGRWSAVAGVRMERTEVESHGFIASRVLSTTAQRAADPVGSARADYNNPRSVSGSYTDFFPGVHLGYRFNRNLQARASWSNSIGRPPMNNFLPLATVNTTAETVAINNPELKPQRAEKWDVSLEYYFEPVGLLSVAYFRKDIRDFIVSSRAPGGVVPSGPDNGYNGDYAGYTLLTQINGGSAVVQGWEFSYQQQLTFLPGWLRGFGVMANYTTLTTSGDYGDTGPRSTEEVADFVPETANGGLTFRHRGFSARLMLNYTGTYLDTYAADASRLLYRRGRTLVNGGLSYQVNSGLTLSCDIVNAFGKAQEFYRYAPSRLATWIDNGTSITFSVSGKF